MKGSGRVEKAVQVLDDAYDGVRRHLRGIATGPHVQWLKETRENLTGLWDKAVALSEKAFSGIRQRLCRATHNAASLMYALAERIAPRLQDNPTARKAVELFKLGAALVARSTRDGDRGDSDDTGDTSEKVGRIGPALVNVRRSVPDVESLPGGRDLLAMIEAVDQAQATAQALPARISRELNLPGRVRAVVSVTADKIADGAERLAGWMRTVGRDEQQVKAVQELAQQSRQVAEQTQRPSAEPERAIAEALGTPETLVPGSVRSTTVAGALAEQVEQRLAEVSAAARQAGDRPMPSTADSTIEDLTERMRERAARSRNPGQAGGGHPRAAADLPAAAPQEPRDGAEPPSVVHTRNLNNLVSDIRLLHIAAGAVDRAMTEQNGQADHGVQTALQEVFKQMDTLQQRRRAALPSEQQARTWWTTDERPRQRAAQA